MDGSNPVTLATGLSRPCGITIEFKTSKLFWADNGAHKIESCNLQGGDRQTVVQLSSGEPLNRRELLFQTTEFIGERMPAIS